jgi:hypothetical protein
MAIARHRFAFVVACLVAARVAGAEDAYFPHITHDPDLLRLCRPSSEMRDCAAAIEAHQLAQPKSRVRRAGPDLSVPLANGGMRTLTDVEPTDEDVEGAIHFRYVAPVPELRAHLIHVMYWEGSDVRLVPEDGGEPIALDAAPLFAPNRRVFATLSPSIAHDANRIRIYSIERFRPVLAFSHEPVEWGPGRAKWPLSSQLDVATDGIVGDIPLPAKTPRTVHVRRDPRGWQLEPAP